MRVDTVQIDHGVRVNLGQVAQQLLQVLLVGMTLGMTRTVIPALAEDEFGVARGSFLMLASFVVAFGFVKGTLNFVAGRLAESIGRRRVLLAGWLVALPIPALIYFAPSWSWIVAATFLLGVNQGLTWSMTQTMKLDLTRRDQRGLVIGLNEFSGYTGVAAAGIITAYLAPLVGTRAGLLWFGTATVAAALILTWLWVKETQPWVRAEAGAGVGERPDTAALFARLSWHDRRFVAVNQAGHVEKFVDALVWIFFPVYFFAQGVSLPVIGWIVGLYGLVWGFSQLVTGPAADRYGRKVFNVGGMWVCGAGVALVMLHDGVAWWSFAAGVTGVGMAMLYPNLSAEVADLAPPAWRASAIGIYRFWRDLGYSVGALLLGGIASVFASIDAAFWATSFAMMASGALLWAWGYGGRFAKLGHSAGSVESPGTEEKV